MAGRLVQIAIPFCSSLANEVRGGLILPFQDRASLYPSWFFLKVLPVITAFKRSVRGENGSASHVVHDGDVVSAQWRLLRQRAKTLSNPFGRARYALFDFNEKIICE